MEQLPYSTLVPGEVAQYVGVQVQVTGFDEDQICKMQARSKYIIVILWIDNG